MLEAPGAGVVPTSSKPALGRLQRVELRDAWDAEATDFTPWLALPENIALLGDTIGIELQVESQEKNVGPFRADVLCKDTLSNHYVLIENQLERTDHAHLGQLLTYAAGLEAATIVWVAGRFTEEHRAALDWLNNATASGFNFFGLEIELWKIGNSPMAPKFNIVSKPNDWSKTVREQAAGGKRAELTKFEQLHLDFWTQFRQYLEDRGSKVRINRPSKDHWTYSPVGRTGFSLVSWNGMRDNRSGVHLEMTPPHAKEHFRLIQDGHQELVETTLAPLGQVAWRLAPERQVSQIRLDRSSTPSNPDTWPELNEWMATTLEAMHDLFSPIVKNLNAADLTPTEQIYVENSLDAAHPTPDITPSDES